MIQKVADAKSMLDAIRIRLTVFVEEQKVPLEEEIDAYDDTALHIVAYDEQNHACGCARLLLLGSVAKIGRLAVLKEVRKHHIGKMLCEELIRESIEMSAQQIILDAQLTAVGFYHKLGFREYGDTFLDAGIEHIRMEYTKL